MKPPFALPGQTGFFNDRNEWVCTGSMMGRKDSLPTDPRLPCKLHLRRVPMSPCGCYDQGGAYWGSGTPLWCAWGENELETVSTFVRASNRAMARAAVLHVLPSARFFR